MNFDIREHLDKLTPAEGKDRYICPVCNGNNLTVNLNDGKYKCWSGCECKDIRDTIAPLEQPKATRPKSDRTWTYTDRDGNPLIRTRRIDDGKGKRRIWQEYIVEGKRISGSKVADEIKLPHKQAIAPYKYVECLEAIARGEKVFWVEGEPCADALWALGIPATTTIGGSASYSKYGSYSDCYTDAQLIIVPDRDKGGIKYGEAIASDYPDAQWLYAFPESPLWDRLPKDGGLDVADLIDEQRAEGLSTEQIRERIVGAVEPKRSPKQQSTSGTETDTGESDESESNKPLIQLEAGYVVDTLSKIEAYLGNYTDPKDRIYLQGNTDGYYPSRVLRAGQHDRRKLIEVPKDIDTLDILTPDTLHYELNKRLRFERYDKRTEKWHRVDCPKAIAIQLLAMGRWPNLPRLTGISHIPMLLKDGTVIAESGYHTETGMLLHFNPTEFPSIPPFCTREDAIASLAILEDWLKEFPFQKSEHKSAALSAILTAVVRRLLKQAPLHALSATKAGTGKGTLVKGISTLVLGTHPGVIAWTGDSDEFRKKITSFLKTGAPIGSIDNVTETLGGDVLEMILTEPYFKDRLLGGNQIPSFSTQVTLLVNGNNLRFRPDMTRRTILCVLDAECESPELRSFERDFETFTEANRGRLVMAAIAILKAYIDCGSPDPVTPRLGSFGQWSDLVRSALVWLGLPDPVKTQKEISAQDDARQLLAALLTVWFETYGSIPQTGKEVINQAMSQGGDLRDVLLDICLDRKGDLSPRRLGQYLKSHNRSVVDGKRFEIGGRDRLDSIRWRVVLMTSDKKHSQTETNPANPAHNAETTQDQAFDPAGFEKQNPALTQQQLTNGGAAIYPLAGLQGFVFQNPATSNNGKSSTSGNGAGFAGFCHSRSDESGRVHKTLKEDDRVRYTGKKFVGAYGGMELTIHSVRGDDVNCKTPKGDITTWLPVEEVELCK